MKITHSLFPLSLLFVVVTLVTFAGTAHAQDPTVTPTPSPTPKPGLLNPFEQLLVTRTPITGGAGEGVLDVTPQPLPTIAPLVTATPPAQCLDPQHLRGNFYRSMITSTNDIMDQPRAWGVALANSFDEDQSQATGEEIGMQAGIMFSGVRDLADELGVIMPLDVMFVISVRLIIVLIFAFIGLLEKLKVIKWW